MDRHNRRKAHLQLLENNEKCFKETETETETETQTERIWRCMYMYIHTHVHMYVYTYIHINMCVHVLQSAETETETRSREDGGRMPLLFLSVSLLFYFSLYLFSGQVFAFFRCGVYGIILSMYIHV